MERSKRTVTKLMEFDKTNLDLVDEDQIRSCLIELGALNANNALGSKDSLFDHGVIDSLGIMTFVSLLVSRYGIVVPDEDLLPSNFDSISAISRYVNIRLEAVNRQPS